jgi:hypothetical protein
MGRFQPNRLPSVPVPPSAPTIRALSSWTTLVEMDDFERGFKAGHEQATDYAEHLRGRLAVDQALIEALKEERDAAREELDRLREEARRNFEWAKAERRKKEQLRDELYKAGWSDPADQGEA